MNLAQFKLLTVFANIAIVSSLTTHSNEVWAAKKSAPTAPAPAVVRTVPKSKICVVLPKAQLGQGSSGADVAEPVRQTLIAYLSGPATQLVPMTARIPIQIEAEAQQTACDYLVYTTVTQKKAGGGGGFGKFLSAAGPLASMLPAMGMGGLGGGGGGYGAIMAAQAVTSVAATAAAEGAQQDAMDALSGASQQNIRKGDQVVMEYKLLKPGVATPLVTKSASAKAEQNGTDLLSPLIEQAATEVLTAISQPASGA